MTVADRIVRDLHRSADVVVGFALGSAGAAAAASWDLTHPLPVSRTPDDPSPLSDRTLKGIGDDAGAAATAGAGEDIEGERIGRLA